MTKYVKKSQAEMFVTFYNYWELDLCKNFLDKMRRWEYNVNTGYGKFPLFIANITKVLRRNA